jgi:hypothetical protein
VGASALEISEWQDGKITQTEEERMKTRTGGTCECCGKTLVGEAHEETHTRLGRDACSYECLEALYPDGIPEGEDFLRVAA